MRKTSRLLASALLVAGVLAGTTGAANANATDLNTQRNLDLWSEHHQRGGSLSVPVPEEEACVPLDTPFNALSARNHSGRFAAELYTSADCSGNFEETVRRHSRASFRHPVEVASVQFVEP
ncbi:hypothetical protein AB0395_28130 [Streptosporangium sp. NPDC051023]|uniref:hypothetical protein n=1 Tax=Streptosporangium sp. NPDC051023 TaxID=3155410 RepID=UPI0034502656